MKIPFRSLIVIFYRDENVEFFKSEPGLESEIDSMLRTEIEDTDINTIRLEPELEQPELNAINENEKETSQEATAAVEVKIMVKQELPGSSVDMECEANPAGLNANGDDDDVMADTNLDAEFAAMEKIQALAKANEADGA